MARPASRIRAGLFLGLAVLATSGEARGQAAAPAEPRLLRWKWQAGDEFTVALTQITDTLTTVNKTATRLRAELGTELTWRIEAVADDGVAQVQQTLSRLRMKLTAGTDAGTVEYDSAAPEPPRGPGRDLAQTAKPLVGLQVQLRMTNRGEILEARLTDASLAAVRSAEVRESLQQLFSPEGLTETLRQAMPQLPAQELGTGETWATESQTRLAAGILHQTTTYTYRGQDTQPKEAFDRIDVSSILALQAEEEPGKSPLRVKSQAMSGTLWFDRPAGRFSGGSVKQEMTTESAFGEEPVVVRLQSALNFDVRATEQR